MLTEEQSKFIAKTLRIPEDEFLTALKSDTEVAVTIPDNLTVLDETQLTTLKNNEYKSGTTKGVEMAVKAVKTEKGWDFPGKDINALVEHSGKVAVEDAKIAPDKKVLELQKDKETLLKEVETLKTEKETVEKKASQAQIDRAIFQALPTLGEGALPVDKMVALMRADGYDFNVENNKLVVLKDGEPVKDNLTNTMPFRDAVEAYAKDNGIPIGKPKADPVKGRGGNDDDPPPAFTKMSEVKEHFTKNGKHPGGKEFLDKITELKKANPDFDING